ncbi:MAG: hypothetical protein L3J08_07235 [Flavobacteriaceae bacterium]|nr:hypothetical protein [Flavobacteriaceae bacterium]
MIVIKTVLLISLLLIFYQDIKQRAVWIILLPVFAVTGAVLFYTETIADHFIYAVPINLTIVGVLILINYLFAKFILKKSLFKETLGVGDLLFFIAFALSFPTLSFINFFVFSLLFSLAVQMVLKLFTKEKSNNTQKTIPLAGYMSVFLIAVYATHWLGFYKSIYLL